MIRVTTAAIDGLDTTRHKRHVGRRATLNTTHRPVLARLFELCFTAFFAARLTTAWRIHQPFALIPRLLSGIPQKFPATLDTDQPLVPSKHTPSSICTKMLLNFIARGGEPQEEQSKKNLILGNTWLIFFNTKRPP
jgi:hypothetical protein